MDAFAAMLAMQMRALRRMIKAGYLMQAAGVLAGAAMAWCAVAQWLGGHPVWSAAFTVIGFYNSIGFCDSRAANIKMRRDLTTLINVRAKFEAMRQALEEC
jgi:hypothetical protein